MATFSPTEWKSLDCKLRWLLSDFHLLAYDLDQICEDILLAEPTLHKDKKDKLKFVLSDSAVCKIVKNCKTCVDFLDRNHPCDSDCKDMILLVDSLFEIFDVTCDIEGLISYHRWNDEVEQDYLRMRQLTSLLYEVLGEIRRFGLD